jgi:hypothetical protein
MRPRPVYGDLLDGRAVADAQPRPLSSNLPRDPARPNEHVIAAGLRPRPLFGDLHCTPVRLDIVNNMLDGVADAFLSSTLGDGQHRADRLRHTSVPPRASSAQPLRPRPPQARRRERAPLGALRRAATGELCPTAAGGSQKERLPPPTLDQPSVD